MNELTQQIIRLKKEKDFLIIAHNYQRPEVQDVADFLGDSLELAKKAAQLEKENVLFCGVRFMAESAKVISPDKHIYTPEPDAGCPMADMITAEDVRRLRKEYPDYVFMAYVNTSAEVKAEVDICCTSSNALEIVNNLEGEKIYFLPDKNLGGWVKKQSGREMRMWPGFCYVHNRITADDLKKGKKEHPGAVSMIHPESPIEVLDEADAVLSTGQMITYARESKKTEFLVGTEEGMIYRLKTLLPEKKFYPMGQRFTCMNMKKITLENVHDALTNLRYEISLDDETIRKASLSLKRMLEKKL